MSTNNTATKAYTLRYGARWNTDDATVVTAVSVPLRPTHVVLLTIGVTAYNVTANTAMTAVKTAGFLQTPAGVISQLGATTDVFVGGATMPVTLVIVQPTASAEGRVDIKVAGIAASNVSWQVSVDILEGGPHAASTGWIG